jgi:putative ABC transport system permease protein
MPSLFQQLRHSLRTLGQTPGPTLTILLTLILGIGANTAIFTADYAALLAPLPYPMPDELVNVWSRLQGHPNRVSAGDFTDWKRQSTALFQDLNARTSDNFNIATQDRPELVDGMMATPGYVEMLGEQLFLGRGFLPDEGDPGKKRVVILTHRLWQRLGANRQIVGQTIRINAEPYTVVGVLAPGPADRRDEELIVPLVITPEQQLDHQDRYWVVTGRLKPGNTIQRAQAALDSITAREAQDYPASNRGWSALVQPFKNGLLPQDRKLTLWLLLGAVGFLLLIACLNVANLLVAQGIVRQKEIAVRAALGASRSALFTQALVESVVLALIGGTLGIVAGSAGLKGLVQIMPPGTLPAEADLRLDLPVLFVLLTVTVLAGVLFGCAPAWYASRLDPAEVLKSGGRSGISATRQRLRRLLVVGEFALALPMLAGAGLTIHSVWNLTHVDLGIRTDHVLGFYLDSPSMPKYRAQINAYYRRLLAKIGTVPGVTQVCALEHLPLDRLHFAVRFSIASKPEYADPSSRPSADLQTPTADYFQTFGIRLLRGRSFIDGDTETSVKVAMVNEAFVSSFLQGLDPLQQRVVMEQFIPGSPTAPAAEWQIVGVFHTVKSRGAREDFPQIAVPFWQMGGGVAGIAVRTGPDPATMIKSISAAVSAVDPQAALALTRSMEQVRSEALANDRFTVVLFAGFAAVALLLSAVGVHGLTAFSVTQRSHEIALRMALGATPNRVVTVIVKEGLVLVCIGSVLGLIGAYVVGRAMQNILYGVPATDFRTLVAVQLSLFLPALVACYYPALRAAKVEIVQALKGE